MAYETRQGTKVYNAQASREAITAEIMRDAGEYVVYKRFNYRDLYFEEGDHLLIHDVGEPNHPALAGKAHVLNLVFGGSTIIPWDALAHSVKPYARGDH